MTWTALWSHEAVEDLVEMATRDSKLARRVMIAVRGFAMGERVDVKKLVGPGGTWRIRVGDWRVMPTFRGSEAIIEGVENRRDAY